MLPFKWKFWESDPKPTLVILPPPTREEQDAKLLARYSAFDASVGSPPSANTLRTRFYDAAAKGHSRVIADTVEKGLVLLDTPPYPRSEHLFVQLKPLSYAVENNWPDAVEAIVPAVKDKHLEDGLAEAEKLLNVNIAKIIKTEISNRAAKTRVP